MSQPRTCTGCGYEASTWTSWAFERWDKLCIACRTATRELERVAVNKAAGPGKVNQGEARLMMLRNGERMTDAQIAQRTRQSPELVRKRINALRARGITIAGEDELELRVTPQPERRRVALRRSHSRQRAKVLA